MEYKKEFFKEKGKHKVAITAPEESRGLWLPGTGVYGKWVTERVYDVVDKEKLYEDIRKINEKSDAAPENIDLSNKYIDGFSLIKFQEKCKDFRFRSVFLKNFLAEGTFFGKGADFSNSIFEKGYVRFDHANFEEGNVGFNGVNFVEGDVYFSGTAFGNGDVSFGFAVFGKGNIFFDEATFGKGNIFFIGVTFGEGDICFDCATFKEGYVSFYGANFGGGNIFFRNTTFLKGYVKFIYTKVIGDWDMRVREAETIDFSETKIYGNIDFGFYEDEEGKLRTPKVNELRLINAKLHGSIYIDYNEFDMPSVINRQKTTHSEKRDQFRLFKENFRRIGQYEDEDKAYYWFKHHEIRAEKEFGKGDSLCNKIKKSLIYGFKWLFFERMGKYGTSPRSVAVSMVTVWLIWALIYFWKFYLIGMENSKADSLNLLNRLGLSMYHSAITFLTIGYGDIFPQGSLRLWSSIEGFLGLFLMAYFTISFARKVLR